MGTIKAVCTSDRKGIQKTAQPSIVLKEDWGIDGRLRGFLDAFAVA